MDIKVFKIEPDSVQYYHDDNIFNLEQVFSAETQFQNREPVQVQEPPPPPHISQAFIRSFKPDTTLTLYAADKKATVPIFESVKESNFEGLVTVSSENLHLQRPEPALNKKFQQHIVSAPVPSPGKNFQHIVVQKQKRKKRTTVTTDEYKCDQCSKHFTTNKSLADHLVNVHGRDKPFKCEECGKTWPTRGKLNEHLISHTTATPYVCNLCSVEFKRLGGLKQHKINMHSISTRDVARKRDILQKRKKKKVENKPSVICLPPPPLTVLPVPAVVSAASINTPIKIDWTKKCKVCFQTFKWSTALHQHMTIVHSTDKEKAFQCPTQNCLKRFPTRRKLLIHSYFVHGQKSDALKILKCEFCPSEFECKAHLELHIVDKHVEDKEFKCSVCSKSFIDQESLTKHKRSSHNSKKQLLKEVCDVCFQRFKYSPMLVRHLASVHKRLHYCRKCKHSFDVESDFDQHLDFQVSNKTLNLEIQLKCQLCSVTFNSQCNLNSHNTGHITRVLDVKPRNFKANKASNRKL